MIYYVLSILLIIGLSCPIKADSIIDSVYSVPELDGRILYSPENNPISINNFTYSMSVGDIGVPLAPGPPANSCNRSYISFELPQILENYDIDSVLIRLYQFESFCNGSELGGVGFPEWNINGGDTVKCILSHIDYGFELDFNDWEKGDVGNPNTFTHNAGTITNSGIDGYRFHNVTGQVLLDYYLNRSLSQYRIAFEVNTDGDSLRDAVGFTTFESNVEFCRPKLYFFLSNSVGTDVLILSKVTIQNYPNPFNPETTIKYEIHTKSNVQLQVFNLKGQLIQNLVNENQVAGSYSVTWNASNQSSGVYVYKLTTRAQIIIGKCLLLR